MTLRFRLVRVAVVALFVVTGVTLLSRSARPSLADESIAPVLNCVTYNADTSEVTAYFGYISTFTDTETIDIGLNNFFSPGVIDRGQPTNFLPGQFNDVFSTSFTVGTVTEIIWFLNGQTATATNDPLTYCTTLSGPSGPTGPTGPTGATGPSGATGPTGPSGPTGTSGPSGPEGPSGAEGTSGPQGSSGPVGGTGVAGPSGPSGASGASGPTGASGASGASGPTGASGSQGPSGVSGIEFVTSDAFSVNPVAQQSESARCPAGDAAIAGGYEIITREAPLFLAPQILASYPSGQSWVVTVANINVRGVVRYRIHATCAPAS
jgi:hypothetical protein